jgi:hypothetical protein
MTTATGAASSITTGVATRVTPTVGFWAALETLIVAASWNINNDILESIDEMKLEEEAEGAEEEAEEEQEQWLEFDSQQYMPMTMWKRRRKRWSEGEVMDEHDLIKQIPPNK